MHGGVESQACAPSGDATASPPRTDGKFLISRHPTLPGNFYNLLVDWTRRAFPVAAGRFEPRYLPIRMRDYSRYALHVPWLPDPVQQWSPSTYERAHQLTAELEQQGIPTINPVERLVNASKSNGSARIAAAGVRTARTVPITDAEEFRDTLFGLELPLLVREDWGHAPPRALELGLVTRCDSRAEVLALDLARFERPVAMEFIETRGERDGLYRKYRYVAAGELGLPHHLQVKDHWFVKGAEQLYSQAIRDEDLAYLSRPDPNHEALQRARRALELDFVAFDYSYDQDGGLVVWEANPYPVIHVLKGRREYRTPTVERTLAAILHLYHQRAGLPIPAGLWERVESP